MKTRKTLKKKRTSKKYNKTQFRRFNKHNNLTSKMKGGGVFDIFTRYPPEYYNDWIIKLEQLKTYIKNDTTYTWLHSDSEELKAKNLDEVENALKRFQKRQTVRKDNIKELERLITNYQERREDSIKNPDKSIELQNALQLKSILYNDKNIIDERLENYIAHLQSDNNGLTKSDKRSVKIMLHIIRKQNNIEMPKTEATQAQEAVAAAAVAAEVPVAQQAPEGKAVEGEAVAGEAVEGEEQLGFPSILSKTFETLTSRFQGSTVPEPHVVAQKMPRLGAIPKPREVPAFDAHVLEQLQPRSNATRTYIPGNGGKSKHTVKRNVKSKKRRR